MQGTVERNKETYLYVAKSNPLDEKKYFYFLVSQAIGKYLI